MTIEVLQETTEWKVDYRQPNHIYHVENGDRVVSYRPWGGDTVVTPKKPIRLERRGRKFTKLGTLPSASNNTVQVAGSRGNTYTVVITDGQATKCTCSGFTYRGQCRHLEMV